MAGGKGMRLRPSTMVVPKPLAVVGDLSIIEIILAQLARWGFGKVIVILGYKPEMIQAVIGDGNKWGIDIKCVVESEPLGTVGGLKLISDELDENFLLMNSDILTVLNYQRIYEYHRLGGNLATIGAVRRLESIRLGVLEVSSGSEIIDYREKPIYHFLATMGIHCFHRRILDFIPPGKTFGLDDLLFTLLEAKEKVQAFIFSGVWLDIGRPDDYEQACHLFEQSPQTFLPQP
jgi:NDP-sugar pyrophosphorylase family protein